MAETNTKNIQRLQEFIAYLRTNKLMDQKAIIDTVKRLVQTDRRFGSIATALGYLNPEDINRVLNEQAAAGKLFGETAAALKLLDERQLQEIYKRQRDDIYLFARSAIASGFLRPKEVVTFVQAFYENKLKDQKEEVEADAPPPKPNLKIRTMLRNIKDVAPLPQTVQQVLSMLKDPDVEINDVGKVIQTDAGLTTQFLKVVNSASYSMRSKIESVNQALVILGIKNIRNLMLTAGILNKFQNIPKKVAEDFWDHSIKSSQWCRTIAQTLRMTVIEEMFTGALLHNIGKLIIYQHFKEQSKDIDKRATSAEERGRAEREILGMDHADIAGFVFEVWQMSTEVVQGAMYHRIQVGAFRELPHANPAGTMVHMAVRLAHLDDSMDPTDYAVAAQQIVEEYSEYLRTDLIDVAGLIPKVKQAVSELKQLFS